MHGKVLTAAATLVHVSRDRGKEHPNRHLTGWQGILQAEAYGGYNDLYRQYCKPGPGVSALSWAHARRRVFELADITGQCAPRQTRPSNLARSVRGGQADRCNLRMLWFQPIDLMYS
jgi:hypothetical protein